MNANIPMKNTEADTVAVEKTYRVAASELSSFVERLEALEAEKKSAMDFQKEVFAEAKARGYCLKTLRKIIALRKRDKADIEEEQAVLDIYLDALGMR